MSKVGSAPIVRDQPVAENLRSISNNFSLMGNEKYRREWKGEEGCCGCKHVYYTTLTDTRLLLRHEENTCCCFCCCCCPCCGETISHDASIFLRDIAELEEKTEVNCCTCILPCLRRCFCASDTLQTIRVKGVFGEEQIRVTDDDVNFLAVEASTFIGNHKIVIHNKALLK